MNNAKIVLEYLQVSIWPVVIIGIVIYFRKDFSAFINNIWKVKFPGGEIETNKLKDLQTSDEIENSNKTLFKKTQSIDEIKNEYEEKLKIVNINTQQKTKELIDQIIQKAIQLDFERIYNLIFGSQITLLERLLISSVGESRVFLNSFYLSVKKTYFPIFENWTLDAYLKFLIDRQLVEIAHNGNYKITNFGITFLSYITNQNYLKNKNL